MGTDCDKNLAIFGDCCGNGKEIIRILEEFGGRNSKNCGGTEINSCYYIDDNGIITYKHVNDLDSSIFIRMHYNEFIGKYQFELGDSVYVSGNNKKGTIIEKKWDSFRKTVNYLIDFGDITEWIGKDYIAYELDDTDKTLEMNKVKTNGLKRGDEYPIMDGVECDEYIKYYFPDGYEFHDVDSTGVYLKPNKPKYPKTYEECCKMLFGDESYAEFTFIPAKVSKNFFKGDFITELPFEIIPYELEIRRLYKLLVCQDAYWKIAGEEMGLGKSWEPDWSTENEIKYVIEVYRNNVRKNSQGYSNTILSFPTEEMRDAFYENFKDLIEQCKVLL